MRVLLVSSLMLGVYTIVEASRYALGLGCTRSASARSSVALLVAFVVRQARAAESARAAADVPLADGHGGEPRSRC